MIVSEHNKQRDDSSSAIIRATFFATAACLAVIYGYFATRRALLSPVWPYLTLYAAAFAVYAYGGLRLLPRAARDSRFALPFIIGTAMLFRLILVPAIPSISTDIYRYIWDGRLIVHGINPYRWAPYDPRLAQFRDAGIWFPMEYKYYNTVYMPVSQAVFAFIYALFGNSIAAYKFVYVAIDAMVMGMLVKLLRMRNMPASNVYWYAWCPLPITEIGIAGHQDVAGVLLLLGCLFYMLRSRPAAASILLIAAGFTKGFAFLLAPLFVRRYGRRYAWWAAATTFILGIPIWLCLRSFLHGMAQYLGTVHVNSGIFHFVYTGLRLLLPMGAAYFAASRLSNLAILWIVWWSVREPVDNDSEFLRRAIAVVGVCLLVVPTLFPWYILWLLPLVLVYKSRPSLAFIVLAGTVSLMYLYYYNYTILWWFRVIEYTPFYYLLWREYKDGYWLRLDGSAADAAGPGSSTDFDGVSESVRVGGVDGWTDPAAAK